MNEILDGGSGGLILIGGLCHSHLMSLFYSNGEMCRYAY